MNQQFGASTKRARERERSALPCRRRKSFVLPSPRVASALLGCCCCCWSLRTATAAADVQFCFQRRHDWTRALQESRSRTLNSTQLNSRQQLRCVCVSRCVRVCVRTSLAVACVRPANAARNFKLGNIHKVKAKVIPLSTTDKSTNLTDNGQSSADTSKGRIKLNSPQAPKGICY